MGVLLNQLICLQHGENGCNNGEQREKLHTDIDRSSSAGAREAIGTGFGTVFLAIEEASRARLRNGITRALTWKNGGLRSVCWINVTVLQLGGAHEFTEGLLARARNAAAKLCLGSLERCLCVTVSISLVVLQSAQIGHRVLAWEGAHTLTEWSVVLVDVDAA